MLARTGTHVSLRLIQTLVLSNHSIRQYVRSGVHEGVVGEEATTTKYLTVVGLTVEWTQITRNLILRDFDDEVGDFKNIAGSALEVLNFLHKGISCIENLLWNRVVCLMQEDCSSPSGDFSESGVLSSYFFLRFRFFDLLVLLGLTQNYRCDDTRAESETSNE